MAYFAPGLLSDSEVVFEGLLRIKDILLYKILTAQFLL